MRIQLAGLAIAFLLVGGVAYYTYSVTSQLSQRNASLQQEVMQLQTGIAQLQSNLDQSGARQGLDAQQIAAAQASIQSELSSLQLVQTELTKLTSDVVGLRAGNITALKQIAFQIQNITANLQNLQTNVSTMPPEIFLRTFGSALASFVERADERKYLRLTETGPTSGAEAAIGSQPFNASMPGNFVEWTAAANNIASDQNHWYWPMVLENSPSGTNAIEFEDAGGLQEVAVVSDGVRITTPVSWNTTAPHVFKIVVVTPGAEVDFYIDGVIVAKMYSGIPNVDFLLEGSEVKGVGTSAPGVAMLDTYGGLLGGT
jgi:hypothetical protein